MNAGVKLRAWLKRLAAEEREAKSTYVHLATVHNGRVIVHAEIPR